MGNAPAKAHDFAYDAFLGDMPHHLTETERIKFCINNPVCTSSKTYASIFGEDRIQNFMNSFNLQIDKIPDEFVAAVNLKNIFGINYLISGPNRRIITPPTYLLGSMNHLLSDVIGNPAVEDSMRSIDVYFTLQDLCLRKILMSDESIKRLDAFEEKLEELSKMYVDCIKKHREKFDASEIRGLFKGVYSKDSVYRIGLIESCAMSEVTSILGSDHSVVYSPKNNLDDGQILKRLIEQDPYNWTYKEEYADVHNLHFVVQADMERHVGLLKFWEREAPIFQAKIEKFVLMSTPLQEISQKTSDVIYCLLWSPHIHIEYMHVFILKLISSTWSTVPSKWRGE